MESDISPIEEKVKDILLKIQKVKDFEFDPRHVVFEESECIEHKCHSHQCWERNADDSWILDCKFGCELACNCESWFDNYKKYSSKKYEIDFFVRFENKTFCIECDGKDFHDTEYDSERDEYMLNNYKAETLRLTGENIHNFAERTLIKIITEFLFNEDLSGKVLKNESHIESNKALSSFTKK